MSIPTPTITAVADLDPLPTNGIAGTSAHGLIPLATRADGLVGSVIDSSTSLLASQTHDIVRFAMGAPAGESMPVEEFREIAGSSFDAGSFTYGATEGEPELVEQLVKHFADSANPVDPQRTIITTGGMQGLDLAFKLFVDPGDVVAVESPTYTNGSGTALSYGARILEIPMDADGMDVDALEAFVKSTGTVPKAIYTIPNFQNPSGVTLSEERRRRILELAHTWGSMIIDDDPYGLLRFTGEDVPSFPALSPQDPLVFSVRTFSKILAPGLRVGWVEADARLHPLLVSAKQAMDTCTGVPNQHMVAEFLRRGGLEEHLAVRRNEYRHRKEAMMDSVARRLGDRVRTTDPEGGYFLWVTLQGEDAAVSTEKLFDIALAEGVAFIPGPALSPSRRFHDALRLCFATTNPERSDQGIERLARALDKARTLS